jgi:outer membrane cobalamin receptor
MRQLPAFVICFLFLFVRLAESAPAYPDSSAVGDSSASIYVLEEVIVYGTRTMSRPSMTTEITAREIQERNAVTVADILRSDPGLEVAAGPKAETTTRIRGFPAQDVLVLVDGRPINPGYYGRVDMSMLPVENIAMIEVAKGPASVAYGANSMGGVINIITKNGLESPRTTVQSEFGDDEFRKLSINHSRKIGKFNYWISGYENYARGFPLSEDFEPTSLENGRLRDNSSYRKAGVDGKLGFQPSEKTLYALSLGYHWAKRDVPTTIYSWDKPAFRTFPNWEWFNSALSGDWHLSPKLELKSVFYLDSQQDRLLDYRGPEMRADQLNWDSTLKNWTVGGLADLKITAWRKHWIQAGISFKRDWMYKKPDVDEPREFHYVQNGTVYLQENYRPWKRSEFALGVSDNFFGTDKRREWSSKLCPMASIRQGLPWELAFRASYANAIRFPTLNHLYDEFSGNPNLKAEQADRFEGGLERDFRFDNTLRALSMEIAFFHNELTDLIYRESKSYPYRNIGKATLQGWELRTRFEFSRYLSGDMSYARIEPRHSSDVLLEEVAPNRVRAMISGETGFGMEANYELNYFDKRTTHIAGRVLPPYAIHNANISQRVGKYLTLQLRVFNLLDRDYQEQLGYPGPAREFSAGMTWSM